MTEEEKRIEREKHVERIAGIINKGAEQILEDQVRETRRKHEHHEIKYGYVPVSSTQLTLPTKA